MPPFTPKQLYMMNGGNKLYIYKDGFGDVYQATPAEEEEWAAEVVAASLAKLDTEENFVGLQSAVENLRFHSYPGLKELLQVKKSQASPERQVAFIRAGI